LVYSWFICLIFISVCLQRKDYSFKFCKFGDTGKYLFEIPYWGHGIYFIYMDGDMIKIFHGYLIKRSFLISLLIFILFTTLDLVFSLMSELENLSEEYNFSNVFLYVLSVSPSNAINFLEGACLLGVMISLGISHQEGNLNVLRSSGESPLKIVLISSLGPILLIFLFLASNELFLKDIRTDAEINKNLIVQSKEKNSQNNNWIKDEDSFLTYSYMKGSFIYKVKFIKTDDGKVLYFKMADSAEIIKNQIKFDETIQYHFFEGTGIENNYEEFKFPLIIKMPFTKVENLKTSEIINAQKLIDTSLKKEDALFIAHLEKSFYKNIFQPISILCLIIFFSSFIFGSLRDVTPASRIVLSVVGAFIYKVFQDFTISFSIATNLSVLIGVIAPALVLLIMSIFLYRRI
jgi:lipopolysaccharide export system permease protein